MRAYVAPAYCPLSNGTTPQGLGHGSADLDHLNPRPKLAVALAASGPNKPKPMPARRALSDCIGVAKEKASGCMEPISRLGS